MRAVIICNGSVADYEFAKNQICPDDCIVCADGALHHCIAMGITPDVWIGDKDSCTLTNDDFDNALSGAQVIKLNPVKDATDTEECCNYVISHGFSHVLMLGAMGTRFDHTLANVFLLRHFADNGIDARIADEHNVIFFAGRHNVIEHSGYTNVSVIPVGGNVENISNSGFAYPLDSEKLEMYSSRGVSNYLTGDAGEIDVPHGDAIIILSND